MATQKWTSTQTGRATGSSGGSSRSLDPYRVATISKAENNIFLIIEAPYDKSWIDSFKASIPQKKRFWDNNDKTWWCTKDQLDRVIQLLDQFYDDVLLVGFDAIDAAADTWGKLYLTQGAPLELVRAAYRILAKTYHPDVGGDEEKFKLLNEAYKELMSDYTNGEDTT